MREDKKLALEKKLHHNLLDIIDEFQEDYNVKIRNIEYIVRISEDSEHVDFTIVTDVR